jgi:hypothetical protein
MDEQMTNILNSLFAQLAAAPLTAEEQTQVEAFEKTLAGAVQEVLAGRLSDETIVAVDQLPDALVERLPEYWQDFVHLLWGCNPHPEVREGIIGSLQRELNLIIRKEAV